MPIQFEGDDFLQVSSVDDHHQAKGDGLVLVFDIRSEYESAPHPDNVERLCSLFEALADLDGHVHGVRAVRVYAADVPPWPKKKG